MSTVGKVAAVRLAFVAAFVIVIASWTIKGVRAVFEL